MTKGRHGPSRRPDDHRGQQAGRTRLPGAIGHGSRRMMLVAAVVGLCAIAAGISLAALHSPSGQAGHLAGASNGPSAGAAQPSPPVPSSSTGPSVTGAGISKTALRYPPGLKNQMQRWANARGGAAWSAVTAQLGNVTQIGGLHLYAELRSACAGLASSVKAAQNAEPIPDKIMQRIYARVLARLSSTAADCLHAISVRPEGDEGQQIKVNTVVLNRSLAQFTTESRDLYLATAEIGTLRKLRQAVAGRLSSA